MVDLWSDDHLQETLMAGPTRFELATSGVTDIGPKPRLPHLAFVCKALDNTISCQQLPQKPAFQQARL